MTVEYIWDINKKGFKKKREKRKAVHKEQKGDNLEKLRPVSGLSLWAGQEID